MKVLRFWLVSVLFFGLSQVALASGTRIGVIDLNQVMQQAPQMKAISTRLQKQFKPQQTALIARQKTLKKDIATLHRNGSVLGKSQKNKLQTRIKKEQKDLQDMSTTYQQSVGKQQRQEMEKFFAVLKNVVSKVAKQGHYSIILQKESVPYVDPKLDLTVTVVQNLKNLDVKHRKG